MTKKELLQKIEKDLIEKGCSKGRYQWSVEVASTADTTVANAPCIDLIVEEQEEEVIDIPSWVNSSYFNLHNTKDKIIHLLYAAYSVGLYGQAIVECSAEYGEEATYLAVQEFKANYKRRYL